MHVYVIVKGRLKVLHHSTFLLIPFFLLISLFLLPANKVQSSLSFRSQGFLAQDPSWLPVRVLTLYSDPPPPDMFRLAQLRLHCTGTPRLVHYEARTVGKGSVDFRLKCLLVYDEDIFIILCPVRITCVSRLCLESSVQMDLDLMYFYVSN